LYTKKSYNDGKTSVLLLMQKEKSSNFLIIASILPRTLNIVAESLDSDHSGEKKHHPDRPVV
jgi:hypothetical protein